MVNPASNLIPFNFIPIQNKSKLKRMGIQDLTKFLRDTCPGIYEEIHLAEYAFKKVAIDMSIYMCRYKAKGDLWLGSLINLIACLRRNEIHAVFIYDTSAPPEKDNERKERAEARDKTDLRICSLEDALDEYYKTDVVSPVLIEFYEKRSDKLPSLRNKASRIDIKFIQDAVTRMRSQQFVITPEDYALTKELLDIMNVPYFNAPMEAETMAADLCKRGLVDAVLTEDSDVVCYETPIWLSKIDTAANKCMRINYQSLIATLEFSSDELLDFCIMCGCDYNQRVKGIGSAKSFDRITQYRTIEKVDENTKEDIACLNHVRTRELFRDYEVSDVNVPYCGIPDFSLLAVFMATHNVRTNVDGLRDSFMRNTVVFDES
jgi:flap endonuclease-1